MAARRKNKKKPKRRQGTELERKIRHLENIIKYSQRAMDGKGGELDKLFGNQVDKAEMELKKLKGNQ